MEIVYLHIFLIHKLAEPDTDKPEPRMNTCKILSCFESLPSIFKHYRTVEQRDGNKVQKNASMKKNIYSLPPLKKLLQESNKRYLEFISTFDIQLDGRIRIDKLSQPVKDKGRNIKGFNLFHKDDLFLFQVIARGEFTISGFRSKPLKRYFKNLSSSLISRLLKRLRLHGLIKKDGKTYKYYLTTFGRIVIIAALKLKEFIVVPDIDKCYV